MTVVDGIPLAVSIPVICPGITVVPPGPRIERLTHRRFF
jgi:hypothetical protein